MLGFLVVTQASFAPFHFVPSPLTTPEAELAWVAVAGNRRLQLALPAAAHNGASSHRHRRLLASLHVTTVLVLAPSAHRRQRNGGRKQASSTRRPRCRGSVDDSTVVLDLRMPCSAHGSSSSSAPARRGRPPPARLIFVVHSSGKRRTGTAAEGAPPLWCEVLLSSGKSSAARALSPRPEERPPQRQTTS